MRIIPDLETLKALAREGKYDVAPVRCELLSDIRTPIEALKILKTYPPTASCWKAWRSVRNGDGTHFSDLTRR